MPSFSKNRIIASLFTVLVIAPMLFLVPFTPGSGENIAHAGWEWTWYGGHWVDVPGECGVSSWGRLENCIANVVQLFVLKIPKFFFGLGAAAFDVLVALSLSSSVIQNQNFVDTGWVIMRDLSNTFFIFVLLWIAISAILQLAGGQTKRLLATLVMVALFMNFSLYITKFVIDVGNVFALEFYENITADISPFVTITGVGAIQPKSIAAGFNAAFDLEHIPVAKKDGRLQEKIILFTFTGIFYLVATFVFLTAAFLFLARVVAFWFLMILSPLAFFSMVLPFTRGKIWNPWFSQLINQTFFAPIFLFFVYLALMLSQAVTRGDLFGVGTSSSSLIVLLIIAFLKFFAIITALLFGLKTAKGMSGELGASMLSIGQKVTGTAVGVGLGATAWAGRKYIGGYGRDYLQQKDADGRTREERMRASRGGRLLLGATGDLGTKASFDVRGLGADKLAKMGGLDIGTAQKGGYNAQIAEKVKSHEAEYNSIQDPKLKARYLSSIMDKDVSFALYSKASAKDRMEMAAKSPQHQAMFQSFAQRMGGKEQSENHKEALANAKDVRDPKTGIITKTKDAVRAEYLHNMENIGMRANMTTKERDASLAKNLNAQREAVESMSPDDVSSVLAAAKSNTSVSGPDQVRAVEEAIARTSPEKQITLNQAVLRDVKEKVDPVTGHVITSANQRASIISAIPNTATQKALWGKESADMRAEILVANPGLQSLEDTLSSDQREQTRTAKIRVKQRTETAQRKTDIENAITAIANPATAAIPGTVAAERSKIDTAVAGLSSQQFAALDPSILTHPEIEEHLNRNRLNAVVSRGELDAVQIHDLILKHLDRKIPAGHAPLTGDSLEEMKKLYKDDKIKGYMNQAERDRIKAAI